MTDEKQEPSTEIWDTSKDVSEHARLVSGEADQILSALDSARSNLNVLEEHTKNLYALSDGLEDLAHDLDSITDRVMVDEDSDEETVVLAGHRFRIQHLGPADDEDDTQTLEDLFG